MEKNDKEIIIPEIFKPENKEKLQEIYEKRKIQRVAMSEEPKQYKPANSQMAKRMKKILVIGIASIAVGCGLAKGISVYNNQQTERKAVSYDKQNTEYNTELYDSVKQLEQSNFDRVTNQELIDLLSEVNEVKYDSFKNKIANLIPDYKSNIELHKSTEKSDGITSYWAEYVNENEEIKAFTINSKTIGDKIDKYIATDEFLSDINYSSIDREKLEDKLSNLTEQMKKDADIGLYFNTKEGNPELDKLKTYSISKDQEKIKEKIAENDVKEKYYGDREL